MKNSRQQYTTTLCKNCLQLPILKPPYVWRSSLGGTSNAKLESASKKGCKMPAGLRVQGSCLEAFKGLKIINVMLLYIHETTLQTRNEDLHQHHTRNNSSFALPVHRLTPYEKKPLYKGALFYNILPYNTQNTKLKKNLTLCYRIDLSTEKWNL